MSAFLAIIGRDSRLALRGGIGALAAVVFFVIAVTLFPLGVGPDLKILARIASGVIWVAALLAATVSLERLFEADHEDGSLDLIALSPLPLELSVLAKCIAHWLTTGVPLILVSPVLAILLNLPWQGYAALLAAMALGTPTLSLIGGVAAALTVGLKRGGALLGLLVLPLEIPVLIFAVGSVEAALTGLGSGAHLLILGAFLLAALVLTPWASAAALRLALEA